MLTFSHLLAILLCCLQSYAQFVTSTKFQPYPSPTHTSIPAIVTHGPRLEIRAVNSICGYWSTWASVWTSKPPRRRRITSGQALTMVSPYHCLQLRHCLCFRQRRPTVLGILFPEQRSTNYRRIRLWSRTCSWLRTRPTMLVRQSRRQDSNNASADMDPVNLLYRLLAHTFSMTAPRHS